MKYNDTYKTRKSESWPKIRKFFNDVHLWLGLISGIIIFLVCISGTIYVFNTEIREMAAPHLYKVEHSKQEKLSIEQLMSLVKKESGGNVSAVKIPSNPERSYTITVKKQEPEQWGGAGEMNGKGESAAAEKPNRVSKSGNSSKSNFPGKGEKAAGPGGRGTPYMINPYTGEILGDTQSKTGATEFMGMMFSLHRWLLLDKIEEPLFGELENRTLGSYITGAATILFTLGVLTGIVIWVPRRVRSWKQGLKVKWSGNWKRVNHDLHNSLGLYSCILLFLMGITGPQWSFPWYREALRKSLGTHQAENSPRPEPLLSVAPTPGAKASLLIEDYLAIADKQLNYQGDYSISLPSDSAGVVVVSKNRTGFFASAAADKTTLDQYTGSVLSTEIFSSKPFNERVSGSIKALHIGDVYGMFSKILYFIACLIATSLPVTGTLIWINKMKKSK